MRKGIVSALLVCGISASLSFTSFAAGWIQDGVGWWYDNGDGSYKRSEWFTDYDGRCYYFNDSGYMLVNAITPDGYRVGPDGAWIPDAPAVISASSESSGSSAASSGASRVGISSAPYDGYTIIVNTKTLKYHVPSCASVYDIKDVNKGYASDAASLQAQGYVPCKKCH